MAKRSDRKALGRGLSALLGDAAAATTMPAAQQDAPARSSDAGVSTIPVDLIDANPKQPRQTFRDADLEELATSIREHGVLQPVLLRPSLDRDGAYQIVAGERRWRAAQLAGVHSLPAVVREVDDSQVLELAIIENVQRVDLDPIEEALGYTHLIETFGYTQEQLSTVIGKSRSHLANTMRLLSLPEPVIQFVRDGVLSAGHARALIKAADPVGLAKQAIAGDMSVRELERRARKPQGPATPARPQRIDGKDADTRLLEGDLAAAIGMRVSIDNISPDGSGELRIRYKTLDQLDELCRKLTE